MFIVMIFGSFNMRSTVTILKQRPSLKYIQKKILSQKDLDRKKIHIESNKKVFIVDS